MALLFAVGLLLLAFGAATTIVSLLNRWRTGRSSPVLLLPFAGPVCLTVWIVAADRPLWWIPVAWVADVATMTWLIRGPAFVRLWWATSRFTRVDLLRGARDDATATLSLHSTGRYVLRKRWTRRAGELGLIAVGETGAWNRRRDNIEMTADDGWHRRLVPDGERAWRVLEDGVDGDYAIEDWRLAP